jgi:hypothetical protein
MDALLTAIQNDLKNSFAYLRGVVILDDELLPPEEIGYPQVGIIDDSWDNAPREFQKGTEVLRVRVTAYQSVLLQTPGASVMGEASLGDSGKGVIAIVKDIKARLHKNKLGLTDYYLARFKSAEPSQTIFSSDTAHLAQRKTLIFEYARTVTE